MSGLSRDLCKKASRELQQKGQISCQSKASAWIRRQMKSSTPRFFSSSKICIQQCLLSVSFRKRAKTSFLPLISYPRMTYTGVLLRFVIFPQRHIQAVHEQERIQLLQRSVLPLLQLFQHAVCDVGLVCSSLSFFSILSHSSSACYTLYFTLSRFLKIFNFFSNQSSSSSLTWLLVKSVSV